MRQSESLAKQNDIAMKSNVLQYTAHLLTVLLRNLHLTNTIIYTKLNCGKISAEAPTLITVYTCITFILTLFQKRIVFE